MAEISVGSLRFTFGAGWRADKYDDWSFYRNRFQQVRDGVKAIDILAIQPQGTIWFIEVKDYRGHARTKAIDIADEVAEKVFDTLAALLPAAVNGDVADETVLAKAALNGGELRVVLHLEQPQTHSKLFPRAFDPANVLMKLKQRVKPIDAHPRVVETRAMAHLPWSVS